MHRGFGKTSQEDYDTLQAAYDLYAPATHEFVIHARIGTAGSKDIFNTHPYQISAEDDSWLFHNGVLNERDVDLKGVNWKKNPTKSDTFHFAEYLGENGVRAHHLVNAEVLDIIGKMIGKGNKFVFLSREFGVSFANVDGNAAFWQGKPYESLWMSNRSALDKVSYAGDKKIPYRGGSQGGGVRPLGSRVSYFNDFDGWADDELAAGTYDTYDCKTGTWIPRRESATSQKQRLNNVVADAVAEVEAEEATAEMAADYDIDPFETGMPRSVRIASLDNIEKASELTTFMLNWILWNYRNENRNRMVDEMADCCFKTPELTAEAVFALMEMVPDAKLEEITAKVEAIKKKRTLEESAKPRLTRKQRRARRMMQRIAHREQMKKAAESGEQIVTLGVGDKEPGVKDMPHGTHFMYEGNKLSTMKLPDGTIIRVKHPEPQLTLV